MNLQITEMYLKLQKLRDAFKEQTLTINGNTYIPYELETEFYSLLATNKSLMKSPECIALTKEINDLVLYVLCNVIAGGQSGLSVGQSTYNASGVTEYIVNATYPAFKFGTDDLDHLYHHTGRGIGVPDFRLSEAVSLVSWNTATKQVETVELPSGTTIDAKDYYDRASADRHLDANSDGSLGHKGYGLLVHLISEDTYYFTKNKAGSTMYRLLEFNPKKLRKQAHLSLDSDGILEVSYF